MEANEINKMEELQFLVPQKEQNEIEVLSNEEKNKLRDMTRSLRVNDVNSVINFGSELQGDLNKYSELFLSTIKNSKNNEMSTLITDLLTELDFVDVDDFTKQNKIKSLIAKLPIIGKLIKTAEQMMGKYDSITKNVEQISKKIEYTRLSSLKDNTNLQLMFEANVSYIKEIEKLIKAGNFKIVESKEKLNALLEAETNEERTYEIEQVQSFINNLEKRVGDLIAMKTITKQALAEIRLIQSNNVSIANKAQTLISTTIPAWRNQLSIAIAVQRQKTNVKCQKMVTDTTNLIIRKNAELLKMNSIEVAKENERSVIDIETLRDSTRDLISTLTEVQKIHEEGETQRRSAIQEMKQLEKTLSDALVRK